MNHLILWQDVLLFWGANPRPVSEHKHPVIQLVIAPDRPFMSKENDGKWYEKRGLLIAPNQQHECDARNVEILTFAIDPESRLGEWVFESHLSSKPIVEYPLHHFSERFDLMEASDWLKQKNWAAIYRRIEGLFDYRGQPFSMRALDVRVRRVLDYIAENIDSGLDTNTLKEVVHLSESRLLHLFKEEMGLPIRNYIQWFRLQRALKFVLAGHNLTGAAHLAGFSDQAHMTRVCVKMMGLPPSLIVKNSKFVQVSFPE